MSAVWDREEMIRKAENLVRTAAEKGSAGGFTAGTF